MPSYDELLSEESPLAKLRAIELEDLLGRDPVVLDNPGLASWISGRTVLVTGAGGSIGTELCNQVARFHPGRLVMVDISEFASHVVGEHIATKLPRERIEVYVGNARNRERMLEIFERSDLISSFTPPLTNMCRSRKRSTLGRLYATTYWARWWPLSAPVQ